MNHCGRWAPRPARRRLQAILADVRARITEGASLNEAMSVHPGAFPEFYCSMVAAGEAGGRLDEVLERLADHTEARRALRQSLSTSLVYPAILTLVSLVVVAVLLIYVVPEVIRVFPADQPALALADCGPDCRQPYVARLWFVDLRRGPGCPAAVGASCSAAPLSGPVMTACCSNFRLWAGSTACCMRPG